MSVAEKRIIWPVLVVGMTLPFLAALFYFILLSGGRVGQLIYAGAKVFTFIWPLVAIGFIWRSGWPKWEPNLGVHLRAVPAGVVTGVMIVGLMLALFFFTPLGEMARGSSERIRGKVEGLGVLGWYWIFGLGISFFHSALEEYYWRWFIFGHLRGLVSPVQAHFWSGLAFAGHHIVVATQFFPTGWGVVLGLVVGVGGVIWNVMYEKQRTLAGAWVSHLIVDLGLISVGSKILFGRFFAF